MTGASDISSKNRPDADAAIEAAGVGTWRWYLGEQRVALSSHASTLFAAKTTELSQDQFIALIHPQDRKAMELSLRLLAGGKAARP